MDKATRDAEEILGISIGANDTSTSTAEALRADVNRVTRRDFDGSVIRFKYRYTGGGTAYSYAAINVDGRWFVTGAAGIDGVHAFSHIDFVTEVLSKATGIEMATNWANVA